MPQELILRDQKPPHERLPGTDLKWFCRAFGFQEPRDKAEVGIRIFELFLRQARKGLTSSQIVHSLGLSRGLAVYYLNKFQSRGFLHRRGRVYELRRDSLEALVDEVEQDSVRTFAGIRGIARELDEHFGTKKR